MIVIDGVLIFLMLTNLLVNEDFVRRSRHVDCASSVRDNLTVAKSTWRLVVSFSTALPQSV